MDLRYDPIDTDFVTRVRAGGPDANGMPAERAVSDGGGNPCRHCLVDIPAGAPMLILAARPFPSLQPYAETGPVFLCARDCAAHDPAAPPAMMTGRQAFLVKGYSPDHRIVYGSGRITPTGEIASYARRLLADPAIAYLHLRSPTNNCYSFRISRAA